MKCSKCGKTFKKYTVYVGSGNGNEENYADTFKQMFNEIQKRNVCNSCRNKLRKESKKPLKFKTPSELLINQYNKSGKSEFHEINIWYKCGVLDTVEEIRNRLEWMVQIYEREIDGLIEELETMEYVNKILPSMIFQEIHQHYKSIMIIEAGLNDVV